MTVRENVHQLVETLPEDRLLGALEMLSELGEDDEILSPETAIEQGIADIREGRTITLEEYKRTRGL